MNGISRILIDMQDAAGRSVQKVSIGIGEGLPIKFGDRVDVAFPDLRRIDFAIEWRKDMHFLGVRNSGLARVANENNTELYDVDISRVRRAEK